MVPQKVEEKDVAVEVENIGGIKTGSVSFTPGVTILADRNATNQTSLLQAVMAGLGSENFSIKGDADEATVELTIEDERYTRRLSGQGANIVSYGDPYLNDPTVADLFTLLLESNEAHRAVANSDDPREIIMRPVDTKEIQWEIDPTSNNENKIKDGLDEINSLKGKLLGLEEERSRVQDEVEEKKAELEAKEEELADADADVNETREEKAGLEDRLEELREKRSELEIFDIIWKRSRKISNRSNKSAER